MLRIMLMTLCVMAAVAVPPLAVVFGLAAFYLGRSEYRKAQSGRDADLAKVLAAHERARYKAAMQR